MYATAPRTTINAHVMPETALSYELWQQGHPWITVNVGDNTGGVTLFFRNVAELAALGDVVEKARQDLAKVSGFLPNGEPCMFVELHGSLDWNEHDHAECMAELVDEPAELGWSDGTAWERHDDPTVEDNPLDGEEEDHESDGDDEYDNRAQGNRILRAEGWF